MADEVVVNSEEIASSLEPFFQQGDLEEQLGLISLNAVDKEGKTGLHWLIERKARIEIIQLVILQCKELCTLSDAGGFTPLHYAARGQSVQVLEVLLDAFPEATMMKSWDGKTPLFHAVDFHPFDVAVILQLISACPQACHEPKKYGQLPIHAALDQGVPPEILRAMLTHGVADADRYKDSSDFLPLHLALKNKAPAEIVRLILQANPAACQARDSGYRSSSDLPLHLALRQFDVSSPPVNPQESTEIVLLVLAAFPEAVKDVDDRNRLPIHYAAESATLAVAQALLEAFPQGAEHVDKDGKLPLHCSLSSSSTQEDAGVTSALARAYPEGCTRQSRYAAASGGFTFLNKNKEQSAIPLMFVLNGLKKLGPEEGENSSTAKKRRLLVDAALALVTVHPSSAQVVDHMDRLPLHHAAEIAPVSVVKALLDAFPQGAALVDIDGRLPLHWALCGTQKDALVPHALAAAFPDGCAREVEFTFAGGVFGGSSEHCSPLIFALRELKKDQPALLPVVLSLLAHHPSLQPHSKALSLTMTVGMFEAESDGGLFNACLRPEQLAAQADARARRAEELAQHRTVYADVLTQVLLAIMHRRLQDRDFGDAIMHDIVDPSLEVAHPSSKLQAVDQLLDRHHALAKALCENKDSSGRSAMHIADEAMRAVMLKHLLFCGRFELAQGPVVHRSATSVVVQATDFQPTEDWKKLFHRIARAAPGKMSLEEFCLTGNTVHLFSYNSELSFAQNDKLSLRVPHERRDDAESATPSLVQRFVPCFVKREKAADGTVVVLVKEAAGSGADERVVDAKILFPPELVEISGLFASVDSKSKGFLTEHEFLQCCRRRLGESRKVVLKFMRNEDQYQREIDCRSLGGEQEQMSSSLAGHVLEFLTGPDPVLFEQAIGELRVNGASLAEYRYCLVMPQADRNLDSIRRFERPDTDSIRVYFRDIARALQALHSAGIMHGDVKLLNAIRLHNHMQLIDLDAAATIDEGFAGAKFSSGVLPPEMFAELDATQRAAFERYWHPFVAKDADLWRKVKPVDIGDGKCIVVRCFVTDEDNVPVRCVSAEDDKVPDAVLPYDLVPATPAIDAWSFGVMMFSMFARCPLLLVSDDDDLVPLMTSASTTTTTRKNRMAAREKQPIQTAKDWTLKGIAQKLQVVEDPQARALLAQLLHPNPAERIADMGAVLEHSFFKGGTGVDLSLFSQKLDSITSKVDEGNALARENQAALRVIQEGVQQLERLSQEMLHRVDLTRTVLLKGIIEANDVVVPSCFVIVNQLLLSPVDALALENEEPGDVLQERMEKASGWLKKITGFLSVATDPQAIMSAASNRLTDMLRGESLYLYLVDEVTMQPVVPTKGGEFSDSYPIEITTQSDTAKQLVPLLKLSLTAISLMNSASGLARCLGYPTPYIPAAVQDSLRSSVQQLDEKTSIAQFDRLQSIALTSPDSADGVKAAAASTSADPKTVRGLALRQLKALLESKDPGCSTFCGLQRVIPPQDDGKVIWTNEEGMQQLEQGTVRSMDCTDSVSERSGVADEQPEAESESDEEAEDIGTAGAAGSTHTAGTKKQAGQEHHLLQTETVDRLSMYMTSAAQVGDHRNRLASAIEDSPAAVRQFERAAYNIDVCVNVLYEAAQIFFGATWRHASGRDKCFGYGTVAKMVSGALVVQTLKKCQSLHTGQSLYYMLLLSEWDEVLKLESGLVSSSLALKAAENVSNTRV
eukprot:gene12153-14082_t